MSMSFGSGRAHAATSPTRGLGLQFDLLGWRIAKVGSAIAVLAVGAYAVMANQIAITTNNAVVSAYSVSLRSPIDGVVGESPMHIGDRVSSGLAIADVTNSRVDDERLIDLRAHLAQARAQLAAIGVERKSLEAVKADLEQRAQAYLNASGIRLAASVSEASDALAALSDRRDQAERALTRTKSLAEQGDASAAALDKAQSDFSIASHQAAAQLGQLASLRAELDAVKNGVVSEPGSTDVAYSRQRADEIEIRLTELERERTLSVADIAETAARLDSEEARISKLRDARIAAPVSGIIWKLNASAGERLGAGDPVAQLVNCNAAFIIATVPQNTVPDIEVGSYAEFRLSGDGVSRRGRILSVTGDATGGDHNLAAIPFDQQGATATVRISMHSSNRECLVGRTARVVMPSTRADIFSYIRNWFS